MPERPPRLECPVCLGVKLTSTKVSNASRLAIDHCGLCGGVWFEHGEVNELREHGRARLWSRIARRETRFRMACRGCDARLLRDADACDACGWANVLDCPACARPMDREARTGLRLDVCHGCRGAWFDHHELDTIWRMAALAVAVGGTGAARQHASQGLGGLDVPVDLIAHAPDAAGHALGFVADGAAAAAQAATHLPSAAVQGFEASVSLVEACGNVAGGVFDVVCGILELLFGLLDGV